MLLDNNGRHFINLIYVRKDKSVHSTAVGGCHVIMVEVLRSLSCVGEDEAILDPFLPVKEDILFSRPALVSNSLKIDNFKLML